MPILLLFQLVRMSSYQQLMSSRSFKIFQPHSVCWTKMASPVLRFPRRQYSNRNHLVASILLGITLFPFGRHQQVKFNRFYRLLGSLRQIESSILGLSVNTSQLFPPHPSLRCRELGITWLGMISTCFTRNVIKLVHGGGRIRTMMGLTMYQFLVGC